MPSLQLIKYRSTLTVGYTAHYHYVTYIQITDRLLINMQLHIKINIIEIIQKCNICTHR